MLLHDVLHALVFGATSSFMSKLLDLSLGVDLGQNNVIITFDVDKLLVDFCPNGLFCLDMNATSGFANKKYPYSVNFVHVENDSVIWHVRLGHIGTEKIIQLAKGDCLIL